MPHNCETSAAIFHFYWLLCSIPEAYSSISWCFLEGFKWNMEIFLGGSFATKCGDSKRPFYPLFGGSLNLWRGHLTIPKVFFLKLNSSIFNFQVKPWTSEASQRRGKGVFPNRYPYISYDIYIYIYIQIYHFQNQPFHVTKDTTKTICWSFNGFIFTTPL